MDSQTAESFDYRHKDVQQVELLLPENSPEWARDLQKLISEDREKGIQAFSEMAERHEKRIDAQVYREFEFALQRELTDEQNIALAREFLHDQVAGRGIAVLANFHMDIDSKTGERKPHCHAVMLTRQMGENGLSLIKDRRWEKRDLINDLREQLAAYTNFHLKMHGYEVQVDHRSYKEQGIELEPQPKHGKRAQGFEKQINNAFGKGDESFINASPLTDKGQAFRDVQLRNLYRIVRKPEVVFDIVTRNHTTFMWGDVQKVLHRYVDSPELFERLEARLKNSKDLLLLKPEGVRDGGKEGREDAIYTTHHLLQNEKALVKTAEALAENKIHSVSEGLVEKGIKTVQEKMGKEGHKLSPDQEKAIRHLVEEGQLKCIVGYAGAGKTTALRACREIWEEQGYKVYGLAPTGRAAKNLEDSQIQSQTLHKFLKSFEEGRAQYSKESVLVLDEGGMVDVERFQKFLSAVKKLGVKAVVIGDGAQLQPVEAGPAFRIVTTRVSVSRLEEIVRQKEGWQREATVLFGRQETQEALQAYQDRGHIHIAKETIPQGYTPEDVIKRYEMAVRTSGLIFREISKEIGGKDANLSYSQRVRDHRDYKRFESLKEIQKSAAREILSHVKDYRPYLEERGLNPLEMARLFADKKKDKPAQYKEAMDILKKRKLEHLIGAEKLKGQSVDVRTAAKDKLIHHWKKVHKENPDNGLLIMAYSNRDVRDLNEKAREYLKGEGKLEKGEKIYAISRDLEDNFGRKTTLKEERAFSKGDRIVFTRNKRDIGVSNGSMGTILSLETNKMTVLLDNGKSKQREVTFAPKMFSYFDQGYAVTIHKSQGTTVDKSFVLASHEMTQNLTYVAMTRHREDVHVYGSSLDFWRKEKVAEVLSKSGDKLGAADYLDAQSLANLMKEEDRFLEKIFTRVSDELQAIGAVTKQTFEKVATRFFGWDLQKERSIFVPPEILREEQRANDLLYGEKTAEAVSYGHSSEPARGQTPKGRIFIDAGKVEEALKQNMASFADDIFSSLGEPVHKPSSSAIQRRYGKNGHISVNLRTGAWINFKDSELSGGPLHMLTKLKGMAFKEAVEYGAEWAGVIDPSIGPERNLIKSAVLAPRIEERHSAEKERLEQEETEKRIRIEKAQALWAKGEPIKGTLADRYLKEHRKIARASSYDLRLLSDYKDPASGKSFPCLMAAARSSSREITAVQLTYLDPKTGAKADIPVQKKSFGVLKGSFVTLQEGATDKPIFVAEGIETALSIKEAGVSGTVMASLGISNLKHLASVSWSVDVPKNGKGDTSPEKTPQRIIVCADHDDPDSVAAKSLEKSVLFLQEKGHWVTVIKPDKLHEDFNDVLKTHGDKAVKSYIQEALKSAPEIQRLLNQEHEKICKFYEEKVSISTPETKKDSLEKNSQEDIRALYTRFKEVRAEMAKYLHSPLALIDERNTLGYAISQDKGFMATLKTEDKKAFYLIEDCASKYIFYNQHEKEGLSL